MWNVLESKGPPGGGGNQTTEILTITTDSSITPAILGPSLSPRIERVLTAIFLTLFSLLFIAVCVQLIMIIWYKHKRCSYQSVLLLIVLTWATLRIVLFSMYFSEIYLANHLPIFVSWLLYCFPVCLQFFTLCLITSFFTSAYLKGHEVNQTITKNQSNLLLGLAAILFLVINITFATLTLRAQRYKKRVMMEYLYARVIINDGLFLATASFLIIVIVKLSKVPISKRSLEARSISTCTVVGVSIFVLIMYGSRALYNMLAVMPSLKGQKPRFGYGWVDVSDQANMINLSKGKAYLSFTTVLTVWELIPLVAVLIFFRVKRSGSSNQQILTQHSQYFNDERTALRNPKHFIPSMLSHYAIPTPCSMFGSPRSDTPSTSSNYDVMFHDHILTTTYPPSNSPRYGSLAATCNLHHSPRGKIQ
ncbi:integral membrane protein GPR137B [Octopus bimaculoides]|uniref:G-protein coupled receptors family 1 profile domain-containing protein n=1 Tax=Octopus bimaculoides TaxID=37653 RepID=A0A0L8I7L4_OCTBM|nr:integral membrane protein GPR137B [Octopus bimaculoides]